MGVDHFRNFAQDISTSSGRGSGVFSTIASLSLDLKACERMCF